MKERIYIEKKYVQTRWDMYEGLCQNIVSRFHHVLWYCFRMFVIILPPSPPLFYLLLSSLCLVVWFFCLFCHSHFTFFCSIFSLSIYNTPPKKNYHFFCVYIHVDIKGTFMSAILVYNRIIWVIWVISHPSSFPMSHICTHRILYISFSATPMYVCIPAYIYQSK